MNRIKFFLAAIALTFAVPTIGYTDEGRDAGLSMTQSTRVASELATELDGCAPLDKIFLADCVRQALRRAARQLSNNAAYWEAEVALARVARNLDLLVRANSDPDVSRIRANGNRYRAMLPEKVGPITEVMRSALAQAESLIRQGSPGEIKHFAPIADAIKGRV
jgi:hypothetical protein